MIIVKAVENFDWSFQRLSDAALMQMITGVQSFASAVALNENPRWLTLLGPSGIGKARLCELLDARIGKWTCITSNLSLEAIATFDRRISSRMKRGESKVIEIRTYDFNQRPK